MEIVFKLKGLTGITHEEHLLKMTLYYDNGKVVIMHDITVETFNKCKNNFVTHNTDVKIVVNDLIPYTSIDDNVEIEKDAGKCGVEMSKESIYNGFKFYNYKYSCMCEVVGSTHLDGIKYLYLENLSNNKQYTIPVQEFDINIILKIFTKCIDALGTDYTKYLYISKETNNRYECDGWNYGCIYISKNKSSDQLIVLLEDLLDEYWIVEKD